MIFNELYTAFRWYDSLEKQNRYKSQCAELCEYALPSTCNDLLPFQIRNSAFTIPTSWTIVSLDGFETPETLATVGLSISSFAPSDLGINLYVDGYGLVASASFTGVVSDMVEELVDNINNGVDGFSAIQFSSSFIITGPDGTGSTINGDYAHVYRIDSSSVEYLYVEDFFTGGVDAQAETQIDISDCIPQINIQTIDSVTYLLYNGGALSGCIPYQIPCGKYYSVLTDGTTTLYSELFEVIPGLNDETIEETEKPLFTSFRAYYSLSDQYSNKSNCAGLCDQYFLTTSKILPTFQIKVPLTFSGATVSKLIAVDGSCEFDLNYTDVLDIATLTGYKLLNPLEGGLNNNEDLEELPCGKFYWYITDGVTEIYTDVFEVIDIEDESTFALQTDDVIDIATDDGIIIQPD